LAAGERHAPIERREAACLGGALRQQRADRASSIWATLEEGPGDDAVKKEQWRHSGRVSKEIHEAKVLSGRRGCTLF